MDSKLLIKTVRGLDQTGPGARGETLEILWKNLAESSHGQFHAAEQSILRWLLRSMNGPSQGAETLRRYPLTWTILGCVFHRIPLFSLAKSLADRKFVSVLQQVLRDISKPTHKESTSPGAKRKKSPVVHYDLEDLKDLEGCLATGQAVFSLLRSLLSRLDDEATGSRSRFGAENIKSLFSSSAAEAAVLSSAALMVCNLLLSSHSCDAVEDPADWIATISSIWDLHLQGTDDTIEVATHLFKPAVSILGKVEAFPENGRKPLTEPFTARWSSDLQKFMYRNLILPARNAFIKRQDFEAITKALDVAKSQASLASPVLYFLAAGAPDSENKRDMPRVNAAWMRQIFQAVEVQIREQPDRNALMEHVLRQAGEKSITVDVEDLRTVCRDYGLTDGKTDWSLLAKAAVCNLDIFQAFQGDDSLLKDMCQRSMEETKDGDFQAVSDLIAAMQKSFCARRNFPGFLKMWFAQLCLVEKRKLTSSSPWFELGRRAASPSALVESELSAPLLLEVISWLEGQEPLSSPQSLCLFTEGIARGIRTEPFIDTMGTKLFNLVSQLPQSKSSALKWRVVSRTISWIPMDERRKVWAQIKDELSKILQKKPIQSAETFEGLKCCYQIWDSVSQDDEVSDEPATLVEKFTSRLTEEISSSNILESNEVSSCLDIEASHDYDEKRALQQYLTLYLFGSSRHLKLYWARKSELPSAVKTVLSAQKTTTHGLRVLWEALLCNDVNLNDTRLTRHLLDLLKSALADSTSGKSWPDERGRMWIRMISSIHNEAISRQQREQVMAILLQGVAKIKGLSGEASLEGWKLVLDLSTKMMSRPTFYEGIWFSHLVDIADELSVLHLEQSTTGEALLELIERFFTVASATVKQMAETRDDRSINYFTESSKFIANCYTEALADTGRPRIAAFRITLLRVLATELGRSSIFQGHDDITQQPQDAKRVLAKCIVSVLGEFMANGELLSKHDTAVDLQLFAALNAAPIVGDVSEMSKCKASEVQKFERRIREAMNNGDLRGWKIQIFLQSYLASELETPRPTRYINLSTLPTKSRGGLLREDVAAIIKDMNITGRAQYLAELIGEFTEGGCDTDGQILAIQHVVNQLIDATDLHGKGEGVDLAAAHSHLTLSLLRKSPNTAHTCRVIQALLGKKPQAMGQWNIEITLSTVSKLASLSEKKDASSSVPFAWLCELVGVIIKKHRLRLEGHHHLLLTIMQSLLRNLINRAPDGSQTQESMAHQYGRLITLICEPTAGAVSRTQHHHSALDSATDVAKRSAGRHMYLVLMQYVKLQLEAGVPRGVREMLEPAMNTIFDITPPEVRKILNDAMDGSGRAILREMFKRYTKFGKWSGV